MSLKMGHFGSKTRSLGQILENSYVHSRGLIFGPIPMKLGQNVCLGEILEEFASGSCRIKSYRSNLRNLV